MIDDPSAYYAAIREFVGPNGVVWDETVGAWIVSGYEVCSRLLLSEDLCRKSVKLPRTKNADLVTCAENILNRQLIFNAGSRSTRSYWYARATGLSEEQLHNIAESVLSCGNPADLYSSVLQPFASKVAAECIGLTETDRVDLYPLISGCVRFFDGKLRSESDFESSMFAIVSLYDRLGMLFKKEVAASPDPQWLANLQFTLVAAHESTAYLLATIFLQGVSVAPVPVAKLAAESIRFDSPVQIIGRITAREIRIGDTWLPAGERIFLHVGAANRDRSVFNDADEFLPYRIGAKPLSFGLGDGQCLGRGLAMRSAQAFLNALKSRNEWIAINGSTPRTIGISGRGFAVLPGRIVPMRDLVLTQVDKNADQ
ncbi:cytochrome P450 [Paraburkholderia lycopersici]|uniref:cytochrome P450 n=1 Tax=Paraburkholderia lycopersici TaxID=416944 RepID=UPI0015A11F8C|nr:cytochrome P450 [Paraburkholderia lycopersici]